jgi:hypothetical protein
VIRRSSRRRGEGSTTRGSPSVTLVSVTDLIPAADVVVGVVVGRLDQLAVGPR